MPCRHCSPHLEADRAPVLPVRANLLLTQGRQRSAALSRRQPDDHVAVVPRLAAHDAELVDPARDEWVLRKAHARVTRTDDELATLKADEIVRGWLPRFPQRALGRP